MIVRVAALALFALAPWSIDGGSAPAWRAAAGPMPDTSDCADPSESGSMLDEPSVQTDPERPITENAALSDDDVNGDDDQDDGVCRSNTLELWFQRQPPFVLQVLNATARSQS